ncbi:MAG: STAS domain-containing protein [Solirubrobacterales bacterium]|nr:STAS domain-containing protein [Solirubrobacterales bacterium]
MAQAKFGIYELAPELNERRVIVTGELDVSTAPLLKKRLEQLHADGRPVRLNLANVPFIDSTGVHVVVEFVKRARRGGWRFQIEPDLSPQVGSVLRMVKLDPASDDDSL